MAFKTKNNLQNKLEKIRLLNYKVYEKNLASLFCKMDRAGLEPILIKGWAAAQYYPIPWRRNLGDMDLVFRPENVDRFKKKFSDIDKLHIDIHTGLRHLDTVDLDDLYRNCVYTDCLGVPVRVLRVEDHLRVLCVHWMNDGGANKEKLWDIFFVVDRFRKNFDWARCLDVVSATRKRWIKSLIGLTHDYLGLEVKDLPFYKELQKNPAWLKKAVEREWRSEVKLNSLHLYVNNKKLLVQQIFKRIPPNPLQATVELEKDIDQEFRLHYQIENILKRLSPSLERTFRTDK